MPPQTNPPPLLPPHLSAKPTLNTHFDAWNTSSTGHQRAENRLSGSTSWRASRTLKLSSQFSSGSSGGPRVADTVGAGSEGFGTDGRREDGGWEVGAVGSRERGQRSLVEVFGVTKGAVVRRRDETDKTEGVEESVTTYPTSLPPSNLDDDDNDKEPSTPQERGRRSEPQIFAGLCIYVNGSTAPLISDHKLKTLLVTHGAHLSISLARRSVSHVVLGRPNNGGGGSSSSQGAGGALAASKIQKEIRSKVGSGVRFVTVEWVLESVKQGKRAPEGRFEAVRLAPSKTRDLMGMFAKVEAPNTKK